ncbi:YopX family protein [Bacillus xiapuensis]|uniref:YopX family protein n=1 Tax=Bacillus xiapuensis TaxID=2014075 RepID=A0ABU6N7Z6_9BACI|nr:YopX family protein [Bacillus xiapuensis]
MRDIKFRAWDEENKTMIQWHDTFFYDTSAVTRWSGDFSYIEMPLMQYTGIKIKGKEVYEGDIVSEIYDDIPDIGVVYFVDGMFKVNFKSSEDYALSGCNLDQTEVIGNVYENKDKYEELYDFFIL